VTASATRRACAQPSELVTTADRSTGRPGRMRRRSSGTTWTTPSRTRPATSRSRWPWFAPP